MMLSLKHSEGINPEKLSCIKTLIFTRNYKTQRAVALMIGCPPVDIIIILIETLFAVLHSS